MKGITRPNRSDLGKNLFTDSRHEPNTIHLVEWIQVLAPLLPVVVTVAVRGLRSCDYRLTTVTPIVPCPPGGALRRRITGMRREAGPVVIGPVPPRLWAPRPGGGMGRVVITASRKAVTYMGIPEFMIVVAVGWTYTDRR